MRVAFICSGAGRDERCSNSIAIWTREVARRLTGRLQPVVHTRRRRGERGTHEREGVEYHPVFAPLENRLLPLERVVRRAKAHPDHALSLYRLSYGLAVARELRRLQPPVVHIHNYTQFLPLFRFFVPGSRLVLHTHGEWLHQLDPALIGGRLQHADLILGCSEYLASQLRDRFPSLGQKVGVLPNGVDAERFAPAKPVARVRGPTVLYVGRVSPEKGVHVALEAFAKVAERFPDARLEIVGKLQSCRYDFIVGVTADPLTKSLQRFYPEPRRAPESRLHYARWLQSSVPPALRERVHFRGVKDHADLAATYQSADVVVVPSVGQEAFGMPAVEAMACGVPVIATNAGGLPEVVDDGTTGLVVPRDDPEALAAAMAHLLRDSGLREAMGQAARRRVMSRFAWQGVAEQLEAYYRTLAGIWSVDYP